jgi:hypothetical protein
VVYIVEGGPKITCKSLFTAAAKLTILMNFDEPEELFKMTLGRSKVHVLSQQQQQPQEEDGQPAQKRQRLSPKEGESKEEKMDYSSSSSSEAKTGAAAPVLGCVEDILQAVNEKPCVRNTVKKLIESFQQTHPLLGEPLKTLLPADQLSQKGSVKTTQRHWWPLRELLCFVVDKKTKLKNFQHPTKTFFMDRLVRIFLSEDIEDIQKLWNTSPVQKMLPHPDAMKTDNSIDG